MRFTVLLIVAFLVFSGPARAQNRNIDSLQKIVARGKKDSVEALACIHLAEAYTRSNTAAAKLSAFNALALSKKLNIPVFISASYSILTTINVQTNQSDSARYYLALLKKMADDYNNANIKSNYNSTAGLFYRKQGNYKASVPYLLEALRFSTLQKNKQGMAGQNLNIGNNYTDLGDYRKAMTFHLHALDIFTELANKPGMSFCYGAIGDNFIKLNQFKEAKVYIEKSLGIKNELNDKKGLANGYTSLGQILEGLHQPTEALNSYLKALTLNKELKLPVEEAKTDLDIGKFYAGEKDEKSARQYFESSAGLFKQSGDTAHLAIVNAEQANLQKKLADQQHTEKTFFNTLGTAIKVGDKNTEINNYKYLSDFYAQNKQFDRALEYREKYEIKSDSLQSRELQLQVKELEQRYNSEKQEKEITLLKKDRQLDRVTLQEQKIFRYSAVLFLLMLVIIGFLVMTRYRTVQRTKRLLEMEQMRNGIARNLHDDIGSSLSSINILSDVALKQVDGNEHILGSLEKIKKSSYTIMESMNDIVWAINPANDPLEITILKMKEFAATILEPAGIDFKFLEEGKLNELKLSVDERKNLYLVFKEALNNIAKYSGASFIVIELQKTAHRFSMKITDNGNGFDGSKQYTGNGLKNMRSRAAEMKAVFEVISQPGTGAIVSVVLPIP